MRALFLVSLMLPLSSAKADTVYAAHSLRPRETITTESVKLLETDIPGGAPTLESVIGQEVKTAVYAGRPILIDNVASPALIERNELVRATFQQNGLIIEIEARALERGTQGDVIRAMNLMSRTTIQAEVLENGQLKVLP